MKKFLRKNRIVIKDDSGVVLKSSISNIKAKKPNNLKRNEQLAMQYVDNQIYNHEHETNQVSNSLLPPPDNRNLLMSGSIDDTQVYLIVEQKTLSLVIIKRVSFQDGEKYISGCSSCCNLNSDFLLHYDSSSMYVKQQSSNLLKCQHLKSAVASILHSFKEWKHDISEEDLQMFLQNHCNWENNDRFFFNESHPTYCGAIDSMDGILLFILRNRRWRCVFDNFQWTSKCRHGTYIEFIGTSCSDPQLHDVKITPFPILGKAVVSVSDLTEVFHKITWNLEKFIQENFEYNDDKIIKIIPERKICDVCSEELSIVLYNKRGVLMLHVVMNCEVYIATCSNQDCSEKNKKISFSGISKGIVNANNKFFIGIDLIKEYLELYSKMGMKFTSWIKTKTTLYNFSSLAPLYKHIDISSYCGFLHQAFCAASELFSFEKNDFYCCSNPEVIQMDATVISIKMAKMPKFVHPWIREYVVKRSSTMKSRQLVEINEIDRKIIDDMLKDVSTSESIVNDLKSNDHVGLQILGYCMFKIEENEYKLHKSAEMFGKFLIKDVAEASSILPKICVDIVKRIVNDWNISMEDNLLLKAESPTLYGIYTAINNIHQNDVMPKDCFRTLITELLIRRDITFNRSFENFLPISKEEHKQIIEELGNTDCCSSLEMLELLNTGCYFPAHRILKKMDGIAIRKSEFKCKKIYKEPGSLGPGVLYFFCVEHQHCIGFVILDTAESPKLVTELLLTRFEKMPKIVLYDNACNLSEFVLNRYPIPFEDTKFYVDGFHFASHVNCAPTYNSSDHPCVTKTLNTSLVEQKNSQLRFLKLTSPYLKFITFAIKLVYSTYVINKANK